MEKVWKTKKEMIALGYPKAQLDRMLHSQYAQYFTMRSGPFRNSKYLIDLNQYEKYRRAF